VSLTPLFDRVVVEKINFDAEAHLPGLVISTSQPDDIDRGRIVAAGELFLPNGGTQPLPMKVGDIVLWKRGAGTKVVSFKKNLIVLTSREVMAIETAPEEAP